MDLTEDLFVLAYMLVGFLGLILLGLGLTKVVKWALGVTDDERRD